MARARSQQSGRPRTPAAQIPAARIQRIRPIHGAAEAVRAGFAEAYKTREYKVVLDVAARLPESVLHEDPDLLMYFDTAVLRSENKT